MYTKTEIRHIAEDFIDELREVPDGYEISSAQLLGKFDYDVNDFGQVGLFDFHEALVRAAKANHIKLDMSAHEGKLEGLPYNLEFTVRNKRARIKCPYCGSKSTGRILYGMPAMNDELNEKLESGKLVLGGCCINGINIDGRMISLDPARQCNDCGKDFAKPPYLVKDGRVEDYRDIVKSVSFWVGGYRRGEKEVLLKRNEKGAYVYVRKIPVGVPEEKQITPLRWMRLINKLYSELYLHEWKKRYNNLNVMDGEQWYLEIRLTGNRKRTYSGSNAYPPYWKELLAAFRPFL